MLERYIETQDFLPLPISGDLYRININGVITDKVRNIIHPFLDDENDLVVSLFWIDGYKNYKLALLVAFTFKPVHITHKLWKYLSVLFKDKNRTNIHPSNLVWKYPTDGLECDFLKGYYYIPEYSKYVINRQGEVIQHFTRNKLSGNFHESGYLYYCLILDTSRRGKSTSTSVGRHRLMALTFLDYDENVESMDVNHLNGIPGDDWLGNLEWATRSSNMIHAYASGLRTDNKPVVVFNHRTGIETEYFSVGECERKLGLTRSVVHFRLKNSPGKIFPPGLSFRYKGTDIGDEIKVTSCDVDHYGIAVVMRNIYTNETIEFPSAKKCSEHLGVSKKVVQKRLKDKSQPLYKNYQFQRKDRLTNWVNHEPRKS